MNSIFAVNQVGGFGVSDTMPWPRSSSDLTRFRKITQGSTVIMGRGTWLSDMPKPLPNRRNVVLSRTLEDTRCEVYSSITDLLMNLDREETVFVIGGAETLWTLRSYITRAFITVFDHIERADVTLDTSAWLQGFDLISRERLDNHTFDTWAKSEI